MSTRHCYKYILEKTAVIFPNRNVAEFS